MLFVTNVRVICVSHQCAFYDGDGGLCCFVNGMVNGIRHSAHMCRCVICVVCVYRSGSSEAGTSRAGSIAVIGRVQRRHDADIVVERFM